MKYQQLVFTVGPGSNKYASLMEAISSLCAGSQTGGVFIHSIGVEKHDAWSEYVILEYTQWDHVGYSLKAMADIKNWAETPISYNWQGVNILTLQR